MTGAAILLQRLLSSLKRPARGVRKPATDSVLDAYVDAPPSAQNAIDLLPGWNNALPPEAGAQTNSRVVLYDDARIHWCLQQFGSLENRNVLELGPLEASHTFMLHQRNAASILAIEANQLAFMRCLIVKELLGLHRAQFMLGDFVKWLEASPASYDLIIASGVLYHMHNPVHLLELMSKRSNCLYFWTHYFDEVLMPHSDSRRGAFDGEVVVVHEHGMKLRLHRRTYHGAWNNKAFCGGMHDQHFWMEKEQILQVLQVLGYSDLQTAQDNPDHPNGPCISIFARR
jgi:hypothetical protein